MQNSLHLVCENKRSNRWENRENSDLNTSSHVDYQTEYQLTKSKLNELNLKIAKLLIDAKCDLNHKDLISHETPLFRAILTNNYELVKLFVVEGADMSLRNSFGNDVLSRSIQLGRFKIARLLVVADSPIRVYSCIYRIPNLDDLNRDLRYNRERDVGNELDLDLNVLNSENFLQYSIGKYEEFLTFLQTYTLKPRSLVDLSRLYIRSLLAKPISRSLMQLGKIPKPIVDLLLLKDIDSKI